MKINMQNKKAIKFKELNELLYPNYMTLKENEITDITKRIVDLKNQRLSNELFCDLAWQMIDFYQTILKHQNE